jgi:hypothetical protein
LAFYRCWSPGPVTLTELVRVAGARWTVVRLWQSWHRFTTLALAAHAILAICAADVRPTDTCPTDKHTEPDMIELTVNEIRRLINVLLIQSSHRITHHLRWSNWRRRHQAQAKRAHYTRRLALEFQP